MVQVEELLLDDFTLNDLPDSTLPVYPGLRLVLVVHWLVDHWLVDSLWLRLALSQRTY